ncbi:MAG TPA: polymer-forming cytoskeletal protein [Candidatus Hydrogenedentes bacterium]|nr:polymer-forming cytoskeletal protein [Candidatus Hydrogenedentota bacterium]
MSVKPGSAKSYNENRVVMLLGPGSHVSGDVSCEGTIRVEGEVRGNVISGDSIVILPGAIVKGDVQAGRVIVGGQVLGNITAVERIELQRGGQVLGDISAPRISIQEGVAFEGSCVMRPGGQLA